MRGGGRCLSHFTRAEHAATEALLSFGADTALIASSIPALESLMRTTGLSKMHMHLNGFTELHMIWPDDAANPDAFYEEPASAHGKPADE